MAFQLQSGARINQRPGLSPKLCVGTTEDRREHAARGLEILARQIAPEPLRELCDASADPCEEPVAGVGDDDGRAVFHEPDRNQPRYQRVGVGDLQPVGDAGSKLGDQGAPHP
jgi:hypothetical protein